MGCLRLDILEQSFVPMQIRYKRAIGIGPLADQGGQQTLSPYHAMGCNPALMVDPLGLQGQAGMSSPGMQIFDIYAAARAMFPTLHLYMPGGKLFGAVSEYYKSERNIPSILRAEATMTILSGGAAGRGLGSSFHSYGISKKITSLKEERSLLQYDGDIPSDFNDLLNTNRVIGLEEVFVTEKGADWKGWGERMHKRFGSSLGWDFEGYGQQSNGGIVWNWMKEHFDVVIGYSESYGVQIGSGFKRVMEARVNFYSSVRTDFEWSLRKGFDRNSGRHKPGEKVNWGAGLAYYGGVNYKGEKYNGITEHEVSFGVFGIGGAIKFDNSFNLTDWFFGFDPSVNMQLGVGVEGTFKIGFSK
ncbi:MAG TPA: hypothetical protein PKX92_01395 [Edaphocola sp.]|nr:hypothetical protein [Edaphocola sp.]